MPVIHLLPSLHRPAGTGQYRMWVTMATASQNLKIPAANNINHHVKTVRENFKKKKNCTSQRPEEQAEWGSLKQMFWKCCGHSSGHNIMDLLKPTAWGRGPFPRPEASHTSGLELNKKLTFDRKFKVIPWMQAFKNHCLFQPPLSR